MTSSLQTCGVDVKRQRSWKPCAGGVRPFWVEAFVARPVVVVAVVVHLGSDGLPTSSHATVERITSACSGLT